VKGEALIRRPSHTISASIAQAFGNGGSVNLTVARVGERGDRDFTQYPTAPVTLPAYTRVDLAAVVPTGLRGLAAVLRIDNALDARYEDIIKFQAPGRAVFAGVRLER
jgi:vitamin B12 transporter